MAASGDHIPSSLSGSGAIGFDAKLGVWDAKVVLTGASRNVAAAGQGLYPRCERGAGRY